MAEQLDPREAFDEATKKAYNDKIREPDAPNKIYDDDCAPRRRFNKEAMNMVS